MSLAEFDRLLLRNAQYLKPFAISLTHDHEEAKDLMQETLFKALNNKEKYNVGTNIKAWLYTIMRNIFINTYRSKIKRRNVGVQSSDYFLQDKVQSVAINEIDGNLRTKDIYNAIHKLPEVFKIPFVLYFEGYKYNEIAKILNEPLGTIKSRIHFSRKLLKEQMSRL
ncbi:MAG: RNA polymerase sigma factor [Bacteroidota bacterium]